jgi:hypothetical protein
MRFAKWFVMVVALMMTFSFTAFPQNVPDNVSFRGGVNAERENSFVGSIEIQKVLTPKLMLDNTIDLSNGAETVLSNRALLRGYIGDNFFVAGGVNIGRTINVNKRRFDSDTFINPSVQTGVTFNVTENLQFEPYVQIDTPDVLSDNSTRTLTGVLSVNYRLNKRLGLTGDAGIGQSRQDNGFLQNGRAFRYGQAGFFVNF